MRILLEVGNKVLTLTVTDSETAKDFVSLLPLTLTMNDLFGREKFAHLPRAISEQGKRTHQYEVGTSLGLMDLTWRSLIATTVRVSPRRTSSPLAKLVPV
jgi:hypothetical protein